MTYTSLPMPVGLLTRAAGDRGRASAERDRKQRHPAQGATRKPCANDCGRLCGNKSVLCVPCGAMAAWDTKRAQGPATPALAVRCHCERPAVVDGSCWKCGREP